MDYITLSNYKGQLVKQFIDENTNGRTFVYKSKDGVDITAHAVYDENGELSGIKKV